MLQFLNFVNCPIAFPACNLILLGTGLMANGAVIFFCYLDSVQTLDYCGHNKTYFLPQSVSLNCLQVFG